MNKFSTVRVYHGDLIITLRDGERNKRHVLSKSSFVDFLYEFCQFLNHVDFLDETPDLAGLEYEIKCAVIETDGNLSLLKFDEPFIFNAERFAHYFNSHSKDFNALDFAFDCFNGERYTKRIVSGHYVERRQPRGSAVGGLPPSSAVPEPAAPAAAVPPDVP